MKKSVKKQWLADLRSGEFKQGQNRLCAVEGKQRFHCCLGVLAERIADDKRDMYANRLYEFKINGHTVDASTTIPYETGEPMGLYKCVGDASCINTLVNMNDAENRSFTDIADFIEQHVPEED